MSKQKNKKNSCDKLKKKVKKLKKKRKQEKKLVAKAQRKYEKKYKKFQELLEPYESDLQTQRKSLKKAKKKYRKAKTKFATDCQPTLLGKVNVVWRAPESEGKAEATNKGVKQSKSKVKSKRQNKNVETKSKSAKAKTADTFPIAQTAKTITRPSTTPKPVVRDRSNKAGTANKATERNQPATDGKTQKAATDNSSTQQAVASKSTAEKDNLKRIEGIGPKIEQLLNAADIYTFTQLSKAKIDQLRGVLADAGARFRMHKPDTWARQAAIAARGEWDKLKEWQQKMKGGKE